MAQVKSKQNSNKKSIAIIPARMASTRFPGKPLALIHGIPMVGHVYFRTLLCEFLDDVVVATCDQEIFDYITSINGLAIMTSDQHTRCVDRAAEAVSLYEESTHSFVDKVVIVQGDEPMVTPEIIEKSHVALSNDLEIQVSCLMSPIKIPLDPKDSNLVKVVTDLVGNALFMSRESIPSKMKATEPIMQYRQLPIITFKKDYLLQFTQMPQTPLEIAESVDLMRIVEHGHKLRMVIMEVSPVSVDVPDDLTHATERMKADPLIAQYSEASV